VVGKVEDLTGEVIHVREGGVTMQLEQNGKRHSIIGLFQFFRTGQRQ
jgi:hypothetical protein